MAKKGVSKISGNSAPVIGEKTTYQVSEWYAGTTAGQRNSSLVTWELFKKRRNGIFTTTHIRKKGVNNFTFGQVAAGETYRLEAYLFHPEGRGLLITPKPAAIPKINKVELLYVDNSKGTVFSFFEKLRAQATCVNMLGKELVFKLWEDDKTGPGHHAGNQPIESKKARVNKNGIAMAEFALTAALMRQAAKGELDSQLEFYVTVEYYAHKKHATNNVHVANPYYTTPATNPVPTAPKPEQNLPAPAAPAPATPGKEKEDNKNNTAQTQPTDSQQASGTATVDQPPTAPVSDGKSDAVVKETKIEGIIDAYFAKKDFTKLIGQEAGNYTYTFGGKKAANNTSNAANKEKVANAILSVGKVNDKLKTEKKYTTKEAIVSALTAAEYGTDTTSHKTVTFKTFALGEEFKKIGSAPLEEKVYLVVSTYLLQGKNANITVKEKDGIIQGSAGAALPISQISEAKMNSTEVLTEADRTEKTTFTGAIAKVETGKDSEGKPIKSEMLAIPVQLRPKSDADLAKWKEKLSKGRPDGTYTYTFKNSYGVVDGNKAELAAAIVKNASNGSHGNPKLESGKTAHADDVKKALETKTYASGATVTFPVYRKETEMLWLEGSATGSKEHKKEFLKAEGAYFEIGKKCECEAKIRAFMRMIRLGEGTLDEGGYTRIVGGSSFSDYGKDLSTHPGIYIAKHDSTAAGAYQITRTNWNDYPFVKWRKDNNIHDFSFVSQDIFAVYLIVKKRKALDDIINDRFEKAIKKCNSEWASLPGAGYKQREEKLSTVQGLYNQFLKEELEGKKSNKAKLHIAPGFLKKIFNVNCCNENLTSSCPADKSQCFNYFDVVPSPRINDQSNNVNKNRYYRVKRYNSKYPNGYYHTGLDILAGIGTTLHSMLCGEVVEAYNTNGDLGKIVTVKSKDKDGSLIWIKYCHLSSIEVDKGQKIVHGSPIGKAGNTGNARGIDPKHYHVHIEASRDGIFYGGKQRVDPEQFMKTKFDGTTLGNPIN